MSVVSYMCTAAILQILLYVSVYIWDVSYQANLGLQLNLQGLQGPLELVDLTVRGLEGLCAGCHLLVQLVKLEDNWTGEWSKSYLSH